MTKQTTVMYERLIFVARETKNPTYLDFYDLDDKDMMKLLYYEKQTIRYKGKWFFVERKQELFYDKKNVDKHAENWIKYMRKEPVPVI